MKIKNDTKSLSIGIEFDSFDEKVKVLAPLWLYQIEELLNEDFIRASKSTLFNMQHIKSLKADIGSRVIVYLDNGDQILVSRKYAKEFKKRLGGV